MKNLKTILIVIVVAGALAFGYWTISPFFINKRVSEEAPVVNIESEQKEEFSTLKGIFFGFDSVHRGEGTATLLKIGDRYVLRFEEDFKVSNGPDLYVGFGKNGEYIKGSEVARLKGNQGSQNYELPEDFDPENYPEVWVWCKAFSQPFARAVLSK